MSAGSHILRTLGFAVLSIAAICGASDAWAQERGHQFGPSRAASTARTPSEAAIDPTTPLGSALAACNKQAEGYEPASLPGARGEIKLDQCYRGRDHLVCSLRAILAEANDLLQSYQNVTNANYPTIASVNEVCTKRSDRFTSDLEKAAEFTVRFNALKTAYLARANCAAQVQKSMAEIVLPEMAQAPSVVNSMVSTIEADLQPVSAATNDVTQVSQRIDAAYNAIVILQKVHRAMCLRTESVNSASAPTNGPKPVPFEQRFLSR